jgi:hypothetical protein
MSKLIRERVAGDAMASFAVIPELTVVTLAKPVSYKSRVLPSGSRGTIVDTHDGGKAYEVEFDTPFFAVATVEADFIKR